MIEDLYNGLDAGNTAPFEMFAVIVLPRSVLKLFWHLVIQHADVLWICDGHAALIVGSGQARDHLSLF